MKVRLLVASFVSLGLTWSAASFAAAYKIDPAQSSVKWVGTKQILVKDKHNGLVKIKDGTLDLDGKQEKGRFVIDMTSIENLDLNDKPDLKKKLEGHLKSDDFFSVSKHPEATLVLKTLKPDPKDKQHYEATGDLTIKGITKPVTLPAKIIEKDGNVKVESKFTINRMEWDIRYNSPDTLDLKKFGDKAIKNHVEFDVILVGKKK
ncbi:YceI family protein [Oligoflexus tunisiensis]|uniref:YceI family protein n=1 Tax=Oligoflexus tunisiensis TaxID=708132 RepID=UPI000A6063A3|nr:YceI family protein [Oligoflexus tunisiensis]